MKTLLILLLSVVATAAQTLVAVPTHPTPGIQLTWTGGLETVSRWTDANPAHVSIGTGTGSFLDSTAVANTIYYYGVTGQTNTATGVVSDISVPFVCPPMVDVDPALMGVSRTETFQSADGTPVTISVDYPVTTMTANVSPCNGAGGCSDYANISAALANSTKVQLSAGDYHLVPTGAVPNIFVNGLHDVILAGAGHSTDAAGIIVPTTHLYFNRFGSTNVPGLTIGLFTNRVAIVDVSIDWDFPNAIPGTVNNVVDATFTGTIAGSLLTASAVTGTILVNGTLFDSGGAITGLTRIASQASGPAGGAGTYNLTVAMPVGSPETMTSVSTQRFNVSNGAYYIPNPASPPTTIRLNAYNLSSRTYDLRSGGRSGVDPTGFNPSYPTGGYYYALSGGTNLPNGTDAIFFVRTGAAINIGAAALNTTLENVSVYGGGATGVVMPKGAGQVRMSNFTIMRKPDSLLAPGEQPRYVSVIGDSDENNAYGSVIIENSEMGLVEDDSFYIRGPSAPVLTVPSTSEFTVTMPFQFTAAPGGDLISLIDPITYAQIGTVIPSGTVMQTNLGGGNWSWDFTLTPAIPELAPYIGASTGNLPVFGLFSQSGENFIIRNSCFHDNHGRIFPKVGNGLISDNVFGNSYYGPIELSLDVTDPARLLLDGPKPQNIIINGNKIIGSGSGITDLSTIWSPLVVSNGYEQTGWAAGAINIWGTPSTGFSPTGYPFKALQVFDNFISSATGLAITVVGTNNVGVVRNTIVDANSIPFAVGFNATYCGAMSQPSQVAGANQPWCLNKVAAQGSIFISHSKNVDSTSTPNTFLGTSAGTVFIDTTTVTSDNIIGGRFIH